MPLPTLKANSITKLTVLDHNPVFFLWLNNSQSRHAKLVVKGEDNRTTWSQIDLETSVRWTAKVMRHGTGNSEVHPKTLAGAEWNEFQRAVGALFPNNHKAHTDIANAQNVWFKYPYVKNLSTGVYDDDDPSGKGFLPNQRKLKQSLLKFSQTRVWEELGPVVAADIFNGNNDRFDTDSGRWMKPHNTMFADKGGGKMSAIGLDMFDAQNPQDTNVNLTPSDLRVLDKLVDSQGRRVFAEKCVRSVGRKLTTAMKDDLYLTTITLEDLRGKKLWTYTVDDELPQHFVDRFVDHFDEGIESGSKELKKYLQDKAKQYAKKGKQIPLGIEFRMTHLGWWPDGIPHSQTYLQALG
jgi:hypothetical protein